MNNQSSNQPNIIVILADDMGYGDMSCQGARNFSTPGFDNMARDGMRFTDMHSSSAVCTPSRYSVLTGRYCWRSRLKSFVLGGFGAPLIEPERPTIASFLRKQGYATAAIGKWHLGLEWYQKNGRPLKETNLDGWNVDGQSVDYARGFGGGPLSLGFDEFYGISGSLDMPPYCYLKDSAPETVPGREKTHYYPQQRKGFCSPDFDEREVDLTFLAKAEDFIRRQAGKAAAAAGETRVKALSAPAGGAPAGGAPHDGSRDGGQGARSGAALPGEQGRALPPGAETAPGTQGASHIRQQGAPHVPDGAAEGKSALSSDQRQTKPFFLYLAPSSPHRPCVPPDFLKGKSRAGNRGDMVLMVDHIVSRIRQILEEQNLAENTLLILTSDNGARALNYDGRDYGHKSNGDWRGQKADIYEGGHREPFLAVWPAVIPPGSESAQTLCLVDLFATIAAITGQPLPEGAAEDSFSFYPVLTGAPNEKPVRETLIHHSLDGMFSVRRGPWKAVFGNGSGGFSEPVRYTPNPADPPGQLYNITDDFRETTNLWNKHPEIAAELEGVLHYCQNLGAPGH